MVFILGFLIGGIRKSYPFGPAALYSALQDHLIWQHWTFFLGFIKREVYRTALIAPEK